MKSFIAVMKSTAGKLDKYQDFDTQAEADAHVAAHIGNFPNAFVAPDPGNNATSYWTIDEGAGTITYDQASHDADSLANGKEAKYKEADAEYVGRSLAAAEGVTPGMGKVRGSTPDQRLTALSIKANASGNAPLANALAGVHDKLETLKDGIEGAANMAALDAIDITNNANW